MESNHIVRPSVGALETLIGAQLRVLDDGFVRLVDYMGDDSSVVQAARVSYGDGTKRLREDRALIRYLMRHGHTTPFEMCELKLHVRVPMDTWRQWIRHRTASVNEYSTRYSVAIDAAQQTASTAWRSQSAQNRQGSERALDELVGRELSNGESELHRSARRIYTERLAAGVAREQARKDLPLSTYTEAYWKINLHNLLHFLRLRMDSHAQEEIREYATVIGQRIVALWVPHVWAAFMDYRVSSIVLSGPERSVLTELLAGRQKEAWRLAAESGLLSTTPEGDRVLTREGKEFEAKMASLGLEAPW